MIDYNSIILSIIKKHVGRANSINQHKIADEYNSLSTREHTTARTVREAIEVLRFDGVPILASTQSNGGYFWPANRAEFIEWADREHDKAVKQLAKIKPVEEAIDRLFPGRKVQQALPGVLERVG